MINKKLALITGSTKGIGFHIAKGLIQANYRVIINGRNKSQVETICFKLGEDAIPFNCDLLAYDNVESGIAKLYKDQGTFDLVVSNIGSGSYPLNLDDITMESFVNCFDINFFQCVHLFKSIIPYLQPKKSQLIAISSIAGCEDIQAPIAYQCAKSAFISFIKSFSRCIVKQNIRVNSISPGNVFVEDGLWDLKMRECAEDTLSYIKNKVPMNCFVDVKDIVEAILFLENTRTVTGSNLIIDAGQTRMF